MILSALCYIDGGVNEGAGSAGEVNVGEPQDATGGEDLKDEKNKEARRERSIQGMQNMVTMVKEIM